MTNRHQLTPRGAIVLATAFLLTSLLATSPAAADCDSGEDCFCECKTLEASAQGEGPCAVVEKDGEWCSIAYSGNTGSVGAKSRAPLTVTSTGTTLFRGLPDHRSDEYARRTRAVKSVVSRGRMPAPELQDDALVILARAAYVAAPWITESEIRELDRSLSALLREKPDSAQVFFARAQPSLRRMQSAPPGDAPAQQRTQQIQAREYQISARDLRLTRVGEFAKVRAGYVAIRPPGTKLSVDVIWKGE